MDNQSQPSHDLSQNQSQHKIRQANQSSDFLDSYSNEMVLKKNKIEEMVLQMALGPQMQNICYSDFARQLIDNSSSQKISILEQRLEIFQIQSKLNMILFNENSIENNQRLSELKSEFHQFQRSTNETIINFKRQTKESIMDLKQDFNKKFDLLIQSQNKILIELQKNSSQIQTVIHDEKDSSTKPQSKDNDKTINE